MLQGLPLDTYHLFEPELLRLVVATVKPPPGDLASATFTLREGIRVMLQDYDATSPVMPVKMILDPVTSKIGPRAAGKGSGELCCEFWESEVIYLG